MARPKALLRTTVCYDGIMPNKANLYYFIDVDIRDMKIVDWGEAPTANLTGETDDPNIHRIFLTKGQINKFKRYLD